MHADNVRRATSSIVSIEYIGSAVNNVIGATNASVDISSLVQAGDILISHGYRYGSTSLAQPTGFDSLRIQTGDNSSVRTGGKIADGTETTISNLANGNPGPSGLMVHVFRPSAPVVGITKVGDYSIRATGNPSTQTALASAVLSYPVLLIGHMCSIGITPGDIDPRTTSPTMAEIANEDLSGTYNHYAHYALHSDADPFDTDYTYDMDDEGSTNVMQFLHLEFS